MYSTSNSRSVRTATISDLPSIRMIYNSAKKFMDINENPNQWPIGYPYDDILAEDIIAGRLFLICDGNTPHGVFALIDGIDQTYVNIYDGEWLNNREYVTLHRVASDGVHSGIMAIATEFAKSKYPDCDIRIDTHEDNRPMQSVLIRLGFKKCGTIYIDTGDARTAYQLETE